VEAVSTVEYNIHNCGRIWRLDRTSVVGNKFSNSYSQFVFLGLFFTRGMISVALQGVVLVVTVVTIGDYLAQVGEASLRCRCNCLLSLSQLCSEKTYFQRLFQNMKLSYFSLGSYKVGRDFSLNSLSFIFTYLITMRLIVNVEQK